MDSTSATLQARPKQRLTIRIADRQHWTLANVFTRKKCIAYVRSPAELLNALNTHTDVGGPADRFRVRRKRPARAWRHSDRAATKLHRRCRHRVGARACEPAIEAEQSAASARRCSISRESRPSRWSRANVTASRSAAAARPRWLTIRIAVGKCEVGQPRSRSDSSGRRRNQRLPRLVGKVRGAPLILSG